VKCDRRWWNDGQLELAKGPVYYTNVEGLYRWEEIDGKSYRFRLFAEDPLKRVTRITDVVCVACGRWRTWLDFLSGCEGLSTESALHLWSSDMSRCAPCIRARVEGTLPSPFCSDHADCREHPQLASACWDAQARAVFGTKPPTLA